MTRLAIVAVLLAGCISVPEGPASMCDSDRDCDHASGEVCEAGVCWGNPPVAVLSAVLSPPSTRRDLVTREIAELAIPADGQIGTLKLSTSTLMGGVVTTSCPQQPCDTLGATITVTRKPQFTGGPGFKAIANVDAKLGFAIPVLPLVATSPGDPYVLTVTPDAKPDGSQPLPPLRLPTTVNNASMMLALGGPDLPVLSGTLTDSTGQGLAGYRVAALGHWDPDEALNEVSSVVKTDGTGTYAVTLSAGLTGTVELVATPPESTPTSPARPAIRISNIDATRSSAHNAIAASTQGGDRHFAMQVLGLDDSGAVNPVVGASVSISASTGTTTSFTMTDTEVTAQSGIVQFKVLDGPDFNKGYKISIVPPPNSRLGAMYQQNLAFPDEGQTATIQLGNRLALRGTVVDAHGDPVTGAAVTARPTLRFLWTLDPRAQTFLGSIPAATKATDATGGFSVQVDSLVAPPGMQPVWASYDLAIEPPSGSDAPAFVQTVDVVRDTSADSMAIGTIQLPSPARVHGVVVDDGGEVIQGAELKLFYVQTDQGLCSEVVHPPAVCTIPASLLGRGTSNPDGTFRIALPRSIPAAP